MSLFKQICTKYPQIQQLINIICLIKNMQREGLPTRKSKVKESCSGFKIKAYACIVEEEPTPKHLQTEDLLRQEISLKNIALKKAQKLIEMQAEEIQLLENQIKNLQGVIISLTKQIHAMSISPQLFTFEQTGSIEQLSSRQESESSVASHQNYEHYETYAAKQGQRLSALTEKIKQVEQRQQNWNCRLDLLSKNAYSLQDKLFRKQMKSTKMEDISISEHEPQNKEQNYDFQKHSLQSTTNKSNHKKISPKKAQYFHTYQHFVSSKKKPNSQKNHSNSLYSEKQKKYHFLDTPKKAHRYFMENSQEY